MGKTTKQQELVTMAEQAEEKNEITITPLESLDFVVKEMTIGTLTTNAKLVRDSIKVCAENFTIEKYKGDAKKAADQKAKLNAIANKMNDTRIAYEKEWMKPFNEFKDIVNESVRLVKGCSSQLDAIVKEKENAEKEAKRAEISDIWKVYGFNLVPLEKIFNDKWLNKTYKTKQIHDDMAHIIDRITGDLQSIEEFGEDTATLKELYLTTLDLQSTLRRGAELRENRKRLAEETERKAQIEAQRQQEKEQRKSREAPNEKQDEVSENLTNKTSLNNNKPTYNVDFNTHAVTPAERQKEPLYTFYVTMPVAAIAKECGIESAPIFMSATKTQLLNFKESLTRSGYEYDKLTYGNKLLLNVRAKGIK